MKPLLLIATAGLVLAGPAVARVTNPAPKDVHRILSRAAEADSNRDGFVTRAEWLSFRAEQFTRIDRDGDGFLTLDDAPPLIGKAKLEELRSLFDADHDGRVSRAEFVDGPSPVFDRADTDHNGIIDPIEMKQAGAGT